MKVEYLFSRRPKSIFSKLIAWASEYERLDLIETPSHMAVLLDDSIVVESTFTTGVRMIPYAHWQKKNQELYKIPCFQYYRQSKVTLDRAFRLWGKGYDWLGICYFLKCFIELMIWKRPIPDYNRWQVRTRYFCTEYAGSLTGENLSMKTPAKICDEWLKEMQ